jgi:hypothetical protein
MGEHRRNPGRPTASRRAINMIKARNRHLTKGSTKTLPRSISFGALIRTTRAGLRADRRFRGDAWSSEPVCRSGLPLSPGPPRVSAASVWQRSPRPNMLRQAVARTQRRARSPRPTTFAAHVPISAKISPSATCSGYRRPAWLFIIHLHDLAAEQPIDHGGVSDGKRHDEEAGAPEHEAQAGWR